MAHVFPNMLNDNAQTEAPRANLLSLPRPTWFPLHGSFGLPDTGTGKGLNIHESKVRRPTNHFHLGVEEIAQKEPVANTSSMTVALRTSSHVMV